MILTHFFIYGIAGWVIEVLWTGLGSAIRGDMKLASTTYLWMFPIYGMGILLEPVHNMIRGQSWLFRGVIYAFIIFLIEYLTGYAIKQFTGACPWDYTNVSAVSVHGLIRLDYFPAWFCVGLVFERLHDFLIRQSVFL